MSGTVLGKSCLVLGAEIGMWNGRAVPGAVSQDGDRDWSQGWALCHGEFNSQVELEQGKHGHSTSPAPCELPQQLELLPPWIRGWAGAARRARPGGTAALPSPGLHSPNTRTHHDSPDTSCWETPPWNSSGSPGIALDLGELGAKLWLLSALQDAQHWPHCSGAGVFQNTDTSEGGIATLIQGFVGKVRIWKLSTPQWVIQTRLAQALVDLPQ